MEINLPVFRPPTLKNSIAFRSSIRNACKDRIEDIENVFPRKIKLLSLLRNVETVKNDARLENTRVNTQLFYPLNRSTKE